MKIQKNNFFKFEKWLCHWYKFTTQNLKLLFGCIASGSLLGLFFSFMVAFALTPLEYRLLNDVATCDNFFTSKPAAAAKKEKKEVMTDKKDPPIDCGENKYNLKKKYEKSSTSYTITNEKNPDVPLFVVSLVEEGSKNKSLNLKVSKTEITPNDPGIKWYETGNLAHVPAVFQVQNLICLQNISFPTSVTAFCSWLKEYGKEELALEEVSDKDLQKIADALERQFESDWAFLNKNSARLLLVRSLNGFIQFLCFVFFNTLVLILIVRNYVIMYQNPTHQRFIFDTEEKRYKRMKKYEKEWDIESPQYLIWNYVRHPKKHGVPISFTEMLELVRDSIHTSFSYMLFLSETIPALGFVGTIIGIGSTMLSCSSVISNELGKQQSRISDVSLDLAFAFDTTLIALILSMIAGFLIKVELCQEEKSILKMKLGDLQTDSKK